MYLTYNLLDDLEPPRLEVVLPQLPTGLGDDRIVRIRIKPVHGRGCSASCPVDRYAPEHSILLAASHMLRVLEESQTPITSLLMKNVMAEQFGRFVEPF